MLLFILQLLKLQKQHLDELNKEVKGEQLAVESDASDKKPVDTGFIAADSEQAIKDAADITMVGVSRKKRELYKAMQVVFSILYAILTFSIMLDIFFTRVGIIELH